MAVWGGIGWLLDQWLHIRVLAPVGIILGMAVAIYLVVVKYGGVPGPEAGQGTGRNRRGRPRDRSGQTRTQKGQR
jgi:F0F1-type ATP synthase assembly protein I